MRLDLLVNSVSMRAREVYDFVRYPVQNINRIVTRRAQEEYEKIELPFGNNNNAKENSAQQTNAQTTISNPTVHQLRQENGVSNGVSNGVLTQIPLQFVPKQPRQTVIPRLQKNDDIQGRRGRYRVISLQPIKEFDTVRLYHGVQFPNNKPILIKEYLLPEADFNLNEARQRKEEFEQLTSVNLKNGGGQDFRLMSPWDAIAPREERRCYLIAEPIDHSVTVRELLEQTNRAMTDKQVREFLKQVLQTLWFLHTQKVRFPNGEVRNGLPHGNLSLDSVLIVRNNQQPLIDEQQFFVYLGDLALWENLFKPLTAKIVNPSGEKDLIDLGHLSFYLLLGGDKNPVTGQLLDPKNEQHWMQVKDVPLKNFIRRLLGLDAPFANAEDARQTLALLPEYTIEKQAETQTQPQKKQPNNSSKYSQILPILLILLGVGFVGTVFWLAWALITKQVSTTPEVKKPASETTVIKNVKGVPGNFQYNSIKSEGTWDYLVTQPSLVSFGKTFDKELGDRGMKLQLKHQNVNSLDEAIQQVENKQADFFVTQLPADLEKQLQQKQLTPQIIAYEGIAVFVPFSDSRREGSLPQALNGKITFEQLQKLYTGKVNFWNELDPKLPKLQVQLYIPTEEAAVNRFKQVVLKNDPQLIKRFEQLIQSGTIKKQQTLEDTLRQNILSEFETKNIGGVGFGLLSKVYGQCSVYPLSVGEQNKEVQPLVQNNGQDINPKLDLCNDKGSYHPNVDAFIQKRYQLGYPVAVVYPNDQNRSQAGESFAKVLKTEEGQTLLGEAGLVQERKIDNQ